jgi:hypothetical protein
LRLRARRSNAAAFHQGIERIVTRGMADVTA